MYFQRNHDLWRNTHTYTRSQRYLGQSQLQLTDIGRGCWVLTLAMYEIHEDASSNDHACFENSADGLNPPVVLPNFS